MKTDVEYLEFLWPMRHYLITCGDIESKSNIIAISFCMPVSKEPPLIACAIGRGAYSCTVIERTQEFVVNVPPKEFKPQIYYSLNAFGTSQTRRTSGEILNTLKNMRRYYETIKL